MEVWDLLRILIVVSIITFGLRKWWDSGFWLPTWLHWLAFIMLLVGFGLAKLADLSGHPQADLHQWMIVAFPVSAYVIFVVFGGAAGHIRNVGNYLRYHARMKREDVLEIFYEHMQKYINQPISNILAMGELGDQIKIRKENKEYLLHIKSAKFNSEQEVYIHLEFCLEDHTKARRYIPWAFAQIVYSSNGEILVSPLEDIKRRMSSGGRAKRTCR